ncbi:hypothetical protein [Deinococcus sp. UR1]|uniref:hypothetical protein n=1 Tax=Deinococcus sp. UR1 TaxID=1704277 RepID=UPI000C193884|nr:hypothetical protein [Deinococcus sp. UR1]PIG96901.1 hypothetical protein AMD26_015345 [Deinococcus sp. UR1]
MTDPKPNPFAGVANIKTPELDVSSRMQRERSIPEGDVTVTLSVRIRKRARSKLKRDAENAGISMQEMVERLILERDSE